MQAEEEKLLKRWNETLDQSLKAKVLSRQDSNRTYGQLDMDKKDDMVMDKVEEEKITMTI